MRQQLHRPRNRLFLALTPARFHRLRPELEQMDCSTEQILLHADSSLDHVYFPENGVVALNATYADGRTIDITSIGREGCTGVPAILGAKSTSVRVLTQIPGSVLRMSRRAFCWAMGTMPDFKSVMYNYAPAFIDQAMVSGACNAAHRLNQRLARWLLTSHDRTGRDTLPVTQNLLAETLGVQRPTMTSALGEMERAGLIAGARKQITILDRDGLSEESCECYQRLRDRLALHLPKSHATG